MKVLVVGANGKIGTQLVALLGESEHQVRAMVRDEAQRGDMEARGAEVIVRDLEGDIAGIADGCQAVVFTAGSGPHTGPDKTLLIDLWGALRVIEQAETAKVEQLIMVSAIGAKDPLGGPEKLRPYLVAKRVADDAVARSEVTHTIVRPGRLNDEPATGKVKAGAEIGYGEIPRADVARVLLACIGNRSTYDTTFCVLSGDDPIADALSRVS